jgi:hypothetical protein
VKYFNLVRQRKVVVTPTMTLFRSPVYEESNSILRKYVKEIDHFLRVNFADENGERGFYVLYFFKDLTHYIYWMICKEQQDHFTQKEIMSSFGASFKYPQNKDLYG